MQTFIAIITLVTQLIPLVLQIIASVEAAFPQGGQGKAKLDMVKGTLEQAFNSITDAKVTFEQVWPTLNSLVTSIVALKNATGEFKK